MQHVALSNYILYICFWYTMLVGMVQLLSHM